MSDASASRPGPRAACAGATAWLLLACGAAARADGTAVAAAEAMFAPISMAPAASGAAPFGALSMLVLGGTLLAGLAAGVGLATLRGRTMPWRSLAMHARPAGRPSTILASAAPLPVEAPLSFAAPAASPPADIPVAAVIGGAPQPHAASIERWIEEISEGPRFGPRLVGLLSPRGFAKSDALARIAEAAQRIDRDVALVDAGASRPGELAAALDRHFRRPARGADPFGAGARVEIVPLVEILPPRASPDVADWTAGLRGLSARTDIVLIDLPDLSMLTRLPSARAALDEIVLVHDADADKGTQLAQEARQRGVIVQAQIIVIA